jgi:hypothetical protein
MTTTEQAGPEPPVSVGTVAAWRRRRRECEEPLPLPPQSPPGETASPPGETPSNGFHATIGTIVSSSLQTIGSGFGDSQRAGLDAMLSLAQPEAAAAPLQTMPVIQVVPSAPDRPRMFEGSGIRYAPGLPLTVILTVQAVLSLRLVWSNSAFTDEGLYLWAGRLEWSNWLHNTPIPSFATYFSGAPILYPPLGAFASSLGGLAGARILSLCFMLGATVLLHGVSRRIFDRYSAAFAAALFAGLGSAQYLGAFATYDAMALFLLALATWLGMRAAACRSYVTRTGLVLLAAGVLVVADVSKYAATLFDPIVIITVACFHWRAFGRRGGGLAGLLMAGGAAVGLMIALAVGGKSYWIGVSTTTLSRSQGNWPIFGILFVSAGWVGAIAILAVIGAAAASCARRTAPQRVLAWTLAGGTFLAPAEQARIHVFTSLFKHVAFGSWFGAVVAGYAMTAFIRAVPEVKSRGALKVVIAVIVLASISGSSLAINHFGAWNNVTPALPVLEATLSAHPDTLLTDETPPFYYYLEKSEPWELMTSIPNSSPVTISKDIKQRTFALVLLSFAEGGGGCGNADPAVKRTQAKCLHNMDIRVLSELISDGGYRLIAKIPYKTTSFNSYYMLWAREGSKP